MDDDHPDGGTATPKLVDGDEIKREKDGRKYIIVTREYMAQGHDGFLSLKGSKYLIDDEVGRMYSTLVRQYFLVSPNRNIF
jgi:5'-nucleotidase